MVKKINNKMPYLFCTCLLAVSIMLALATLIIRPNKQASKNLYDASSKTVIEEIVFPFVQNIEIKEDAYSLTLYLESDSINKFDYNITLSDEISEYFNNDFHNYNSNIALIVPNKKLNPGKYKLKFTCNDCKNVKIAKRKSIGNNFIDIENTNSLKLTYGTYTKNNTYYWYAVMGIIIAITLLPLTRGDNDEK